MSSVSGSKADVTIGELRDLALLLAVFLFFVGFAYTSTYYRNLGIRASSLELSINDIIVSSYNVILTWPFLLGALVCAACLAGATKWLPKWGRVASYLALAIAFLPFARHVGSAVAARNAMDTRAGLFDAAVEVAFEPTVESRVPELLRVANTANRLRLLYETKDHVFLLDQVDTGRDELPIGHVYEVSRDHIVALTMQVPNALRRTRR